MSTEPTNTTLQDITKTCADCAAEFIHSVADQERYAQKGFTHQPKRCPTCREKRRNQPAGGEPDGNRAPATRSMDAPPRRSFDRGGDRDRGPRRGGFGGGGGGGSRGPRQDYAATCAACGAQTTVPFKPTEGRPVYCRDCFRANRPARH